MTSRPGSWPSSACRYASSPAGRDGRCPWPRWSASCAGRVDPEASPGLREQAAIRLARLADASDRDGHPLAPAPPRALVGDAATDSADQPVVPARSRCGCRAASWPGSWPARGSGSWPGRPRLSRHGRRRRASARWSTCWPTTARAPIADLAELTDHLDTVWRQLDFDANWLSAVERVEAESALERFVTWQEARPQLDALGTEVAFSCASTWAASGSS